ncbi:MAG: hypothetical protein JO325_03205 [Solirubrobacterales bacterium]|nr:hypothetical protein [Solirubrobacterales bacterium]
MSEKDVVVARRWDRDLIVAVTSGLVGLLALAVSTYNVTLQHKQVRAQVWPRLLLMPSFNHENGFSYSLENGGIGPAEVRTARVTVDGKPVKNWHDAILLMTGKDFNDWTWGTIHGTLATPGSNRTVLTIKDEAIGGIMFKQQNRLSAEICYCSALEDCWVLEDNAPRLVSKCPDYSDAFND